MSQEWVRTYTRKYEELVSSSTVTDGLPLVIALESWRVDLQGKWDQLDLFLFWIESAMAPSDTVSKELWNSIPKLIARYPDGNYTGYKLVQVDFPGLIDRFVTFACDTMGLPAPQAPDIDFSLFESPNNSSSKDQAFQGTEMTTISEQRTQVKTPNDLIEEFLGTPFADDAKAAVASGAASSADNKDSSIDWTRSGAEKKNDDGMVGLENQGATCYLNSVLQSLYMTPEFRNALYSYTPKNGPGDNSISEQLQTTFAMLQLSSFKAVQTTGLTKSFGWNSFEAFEQHDVQELFQILLDEVQKDFASAGLSSPDQLFDVRLNDYITCKKCNVESARIAKCLDISLPVKDFSSFEDALSQFLKPEILEGPNAYRCDRCNDLVTAEKGFKIHELPYILNITLKRFDLDLETLTRVKLNHKVTFPFRLDVRPFLSLETEKSTIYELFSVLVHAGVAAGGHYFAYIKNVETNKWYCFNDRSVTVTDEAVVQEAYGKDKNTPSAYVLLYRRVEAGNTQFLPSNLIPQSVKERVKNEEEENDPSLIQINVYQRIGDKKENISIRISKDLTLEATEDLVFKRLKIAEQGFDRDQIRLRFYNKHNDDLLPPFKPDDKWTPIDFLKFYNSRSVMVETRAKGEEFPGAVDQMCLQVSKFDVQKKEAEAWKDVFVDKNVSFASLQQHLSVVFAVPEDQIYIVKISQSMYGLKWSVIDSLEPARPVSNLFGGSKLFVIHKESSQILADHLDSQKSVISVKFNLPENEFDYSQQTMIDRNWTVAQLKIHLAPFIGYDPSEFIVGKGAFYGESSTFIDENAKLCDPGVGLINESNVHIKLGEAKRASEVNTKISIFDLSKEGVTTLFEHPLDHKSTVLEVKKVLQTQLREFFQTTLSVEQMRLREVSESKVGKVLSNTKTLGEQLRPRVLFEEIHIAVQKVETPDPEIIDDSLLLLAYQVFYASKFELGEKREVWLNRYETMFQNEQRLSSETGIPADELRVTRPLWWKGDLLEVPRMLWIKISDDSNKERLLAQATIEFSSGTLIFVKNESEELKILSDDERKEMQSLAAARKLAQETDLFGGILSMPFSGAGAGVKSPYGKEHGIKIKSRHDNPEK